MSEQRLLARLWSLITLLFLVAAQRVLALIVRIVRRQAAPAAATRLHTVRIDVAAGVSAEQLGTRIGTAAWYRERGVQLTHPLSPVGRLQGSVDVTVDGEGLRRLPSDELHQHTLALLAEHAHRARRPA